MHELSLAQGLLTQLHDLAARHQARRIIRIRVEIGPLSGIVVDSFEFGFNCLSAESPLTKDAELNITIPANDSSDIILLQVEMDSEEDDSVNDQLEPAIP